MAMKRDSDKKEKNVNTENKERGRRDRPGLFLLLAVLLGTVLCVGLLFALIRCPKDPAPNAETDTESGTETNEESETRPDPNGETGKCTETETKSPAPRDPESADPESEQNLVLDSGEWEDPRPRTPGVSGLTVLPLEAEP